MEDIIIVSIFIVLSGFVALELGFATAIAELLAGITAHELISFQSTEVIVVLADIGILILMYVAGLEIDLDVLRQSFKPSVAIGFSSFIFPFISIIFISKYLLCFTTEQALLTGIALSTTSIAIVYPTLRQSGALNKERKMILSAAMITDLLSMSALGILFLTWSTLLIVLIMGLFLFTFLFPLFGSRIFKYYKGNVAEFEFKIILLLLLVVAIASEKAGIESALIAFILGMITSGVVVEHENLQIKLRGLAFGFFAPIFFFTVGLSIGIMDFVSNILLLSAFLIICFVAKYVGTYFASKRYVPGSAGYVAALFNSRLSLGIIATVLGLKSGIFTQGIYSAIIGAVVLSSIISSVICRSRSWAIK